jgi:putative ABC transport system permease protein
MKQELRMAWRNLWRNKRRTVITSASVFFAVFFAVIMRSIQLGSYDRMIMNFIGSYSGYLQIQNSDYLGDPSIDNSFTCTDSLEKGALKIKNVVSVAPHIESFVLASEGTLTKGIIVLAIDPEKEKSFSDPENKLVRYVVSDSAIKFLEHLPGFPPDMTEKLKKKTGSSYSSRQGFELDLETSANESGLIGKILDACSVSNGYLRNDDEGILVSSRLAAFLKVSIGDTLVLMGQGYHGSSAAGLFPVRGILKMPSPDIDSRLAMMTISEAKKFFSSDKITSLAVNLTSKSDRVISGTSGELSRILPDRSIVVRTWKELNPVLVQQIRGDSQTGLATLFLLYFIIFFGIFGTVLMMMAERTREFGVLISIGMQRGKLKRILVIEMLLLGITGLLSGLAASAPVIAYYNIHPVVLKGDLGKMMENYGWDAVMPTAWFGPYFYWQALVVFVMVIAALLYPLRKISTLKEIEALRS